MFLRITFYIEAVEVPLELRNLERRVCKTNDCLNRFLQAVHADSVAHLRSELGNQLAAKSLKNGLRYVESHVKNSLGIDAIVQALLDMS